MPTDFVNDIREFQARFGVESEPDPTFPPADKSAFRFEHLAEELHELGVAIDQCDLDGIADALVDLTYIAIGAALEWGINFEACWEEVHRANMSKVRASADGSDSKRGSSLDIVKPEGWTEPNIHEAMWQPHPPHYATILEHAHHIIDRRAEEGHREYGSIHENFVHTALIAGILQNKEFTPQDCIAVLASLKLARHNRSYKQDSLLDAVAYLGALDNDIQGYGDDRCGS